MGEQGESAERGTVDPQAPVGPICRLGVESSLGVGSRLAANVSVGDRVRIGVAVQVGHGAFVGDDAVIGDAACVGPNAVVGAADGRGSRAAGGVRIGDGAVVGANATLLAGVVVGRGAVVGVGAVVDRDVPPNAEVTGNPARIVGYRTTHADAGRDTTVASAVDASDLPYALAGGWLLRTPRIDDLRGSLTFAEHPGILPFSPARYFIVHDVPSREVRGEHAHRALHQLLISVAGDCSVVLDDGTDRAEVLLDHPSAALHIPPMVWATQYRYSERSALLVLASAQYDEADYIRDYDDFLELVGSA